MTETKADPSQSLELEAAKPKNRPVDALSDLMVTEGSKEVTQNESKLEEHKSAIKEYVFDGIPDSKDYSSKPEPQPQESATLEHKYY
mmetsp:Transcript_39672/g.60775  ORF Transcript_39672/g.60775 Transcript_39672/m.60775 type:complete len:87 (-) Transcript_39672:356-616(-)